MAAMHPLRTLRRLGWLLAAGCGILLAGCTNRPRPAASYKGPVIALTDSILRSGGSDTVRFGRLRSGEIAVQRLRIENRTDRPMVIVSYGTSCGCSRLEFDNHPIMPGDSQYAELTFDSRGEFGWQLKRLDITLAGTSRPLRIFVEAEIE